MSDNANMNSRLLEQLLQQIQELTRGQAKLTQDVGKLTQDVGKLTQDVGKLTQGQEKLTQEVGEIHSKVDRILCELNPHAATFLERTCVLSRETAQSLFSQEKNGVFTLFADGSRAIGSAHTALRYGTIASRRTGLRFVCLEKSLIDRQVVQVAFPATNEELRNPLPPSLDICMLRFQHVNPQESWVHYPQEPARPPQDNLRAELRASNIVGKSGGSVVTNRGGAVSVAINGDGRGSFEFLLDLGEPGDSGTLLYLEDTENNWSPRGIFCGLSPRTNSSTRYGQAAWIPPERCFRWHETTDLGEYFEITLFDRNRHQRSFVATRGSHGGGYTLKDSSGREQYHGVFIETEQEITYVGDNDIAVMMSYAHRSTHCQSSLGSSLSGPSKCW